LVIAANREASGESSLVVREGDRELWRTTEAAHVGWIQPFVSGSQAAVLWTAGSGMTIELLRWTGSKCESVLSQSTEGQPEFVFRTRTGEPDVVVSFWHLTPEADVVTVPLARRFRWSGTRYVRDDPPSWKARLGE
jgi:hypothetical protein